MSDLLLREYLARQSDSEAAHSHPQRILAIGGGGFQEEGVESPIDDYLVMLTGKSAPRICLLATPSGDRPDYIQAFHSAYGRRGCEPSHIAFFEREPQLGAVSLSSLESHLPEQDAIFVSGGNTRAAVAIWREWGVDRILAQAMDRGVLLAGMSAGAMCWFQAALTDTYWEPGYRAIPGLGFLAGGCRVHYSNLPHQRARLHAALLARAVPPSIAISDGAAVLYQAGKIEHAVTWVPAALHATLTLKTALCVSTSVTAEHWREHECPGLPCFSMPLRFAILTSCRR